MGGVLVLVFGLYLLGVFNLGGFRARAPNAHHRQAAGLPRDGRRWHGVRRGMDAVHRPDPRDHSDLCGDAGARCRAASMLLGAYSLGLALPFVLAAVAIERFVARSSGCAREWCWMSRISGAMLVVVAVLMITGLHDGAHRRSSGRGRRRR